MAAKTTVKVATLTGAAKDDVLTSATTGLTEDAVSANLNVLANDPGAARLYSLLQSTAGLTSTTQFPVVNTATLASGATITMNTDGTISYNASTLQASLQSYAAGETFTDTFTYTVRMANGALSTATATVSIAGANDAPTLAGVEAVSILDTAADDTPAAVAGTLAGADVDHGAVLTYSFADGTLTSTNDYGTITLDALSGAYSFVANADAIDALAAGADANASFAVQVSDEFGASASTTLSFNLIGANDTAEISGSATGAVAEDGTLTASGTLSVSDRDAGQSGFQSVATVAGAFGDFTFDAATGEWTYTLRNDDANVQALTAAQGAFDELVITSLDGSATQTIQIDISGADEPLPPTNPTGLPQEPVSTVTTFKVNYGQADVNGKQTFYGFDSDDLVVFTKNYTFTGDITLVDTDNDSVMDSSMATFSWGNGNKDSVSVVLIGYTDLTAADIVPVSGA
jgi:VCBS repeat-containing protein